MSRTLIFTPFEHGYIAALEHIFNKGPLVDKENVIDIPHVLLSALTMSGVDNISSMGKFENSNTTLVKSITSKSSAKKWNEVYTKTKNIIDAYKSDAKSGKVKKELDEVQHKISQLLFSLKTNSGIITFSNFTELKNKDILPIDIAVPLEILMSSIQTKSANLPVLKYETDKKDIRRFITILESKEFKYYKEAQSEIEQNQNLTSKTIKAIEIAGKDLYKKNISHIEIKENALKAIPLTGKVVELFFGKLPGVLTDFSATVVGDYLKLNKSIPIYSCEPIIKQIKMASLQAQVLKIHEIKKSKNN
jgi:hypothetical protein